MAGFSKTSALPEIVSFWTGAPLSFTEQLCLKSFADMGHPTTLYSYGQIEGVPDGVATADASAILPEPDAMVVHPRTGSPAPFADRFRYHLLRKRPGVIWADTDAYCLRPFVPTDGYFLGFCDRNNRIANNGVLALPAHSPALQLLIAFTSDEDLIMPWLSKGLMDQARARADAGDPMHVTEMPWGIWGPSALSWALRQTGEIRYAQPHDALYPILFEDRRMFFRRARHIRRKLTEQTCSIHFYGRRVRSRLKSQHDDIPPTYTIMHQLGLEHGLTQPNPVYA
jgi:hypothetical protein